jgi:hypothetical protein
MVNKKPAQERAFLWVIAESLQLDFPVVHVLASDGIKFLDQHLVGRGLFVFGRGVEMAGSSGGFQLDLFARAFGCHGGSP